MYSEERSNSNRLSEEVVVIYHNSHHLKNAKMKPNFE